MDSIKHGLNSAAKMGKSGYQSGKRQLNRSRNRDSEMLGHRTHAASPRQQGYDTKQYGQDTSSNTRTGTVDVQSLAPPPVHFQREQMSHTSRYHGTTSNERHRNNTREHDRYDSRIYDDRKENGGMRGNNAHERSRDRDGLSSPDRRTDDLHDNERYNSARRDSKSTPYERDLNEGRYERDGRDNKRSTYYGRNDKNEQGYRVTERGNDQRTFDRSDDVDDFYSGRRIPERPGGDKVEARVAANEENGLVPPPLPNRTKVQSQSQSQSYREDYDYNDGENAGKSGHYSGVDEIRSPVNNTHGLQAQTRNNSMPSMTKTETDSTSHPANSQSHVTIHKITLSMGGITEELSQIRLRPTSGDSNEGLDVGQSPEGSFNVVKKVPPTVPIKKDILKKGAPPMVPTKKPVLKDVSISNNDNNDNDIENSTLSPLERYKRKITESNA